MTNVANKSETDNCPACGKPVFSPGWQTYPERYNRPSRLLVHCVTIGCPMYYMTTTNLESTWSAVQEAQNGHTAKRGASFEETSS